MVKWTATLLCLSLAATASTASSLPTVCKAINTSTADVTAADGPHTQATHVVCAPAVTPTHSNDASQSQLVLFFGGSGSTPTQDYFSAFYDHTAAVLGFHLISLNYPDTPTVAHACTNHSPSCFKTVRLQRLEVAGVRLRHLMAQLCPGKKSEWCRFLGTSTEQVLDWGRVVVAGHSQGAGMAALIGKMQLVAGVVQLAGVDDVYMTPNGTVEPAPWVSVPGLTPPNRVYGLGNSRGFCCVNWNVNWPAMNMTGWVDVDGTDPSRWQGHMLCSHKDDGIQGHGAVLQDATSYAPAWTYMLGRGGALGTGRGTATTSPHEQGCRCPNTIADTATSTHAPPPNKVTQLPLHVAVRTDAVRDVVLSNVALPVAARSGAPIITGEAHVLSNTARDGFFYVYFNNWVGGCFCALSCTANAPPRCADEVCPRNATDPAHTVVGYRTSDFAEWEYLGVVFRNPDGPSGNLIERPKVIFCPVTQKFVLWYERYCGKSHCSSGRTSYAVATARDPRGPFTSVTFHANTTNQHHDANVMVDDDGTAYHISMHLLPCWPHVKGPGRCAGLLIQKLSADFLSATSEQHFLNISVTQKAALEAPILFRRGDYYYVTAGSLSCAQSGGTDVFAWKARHPLGPYTVASTAPRGQIFTRMVSRAQGSTVFEIGGNFVWLGNQWLTSKTQERNHDLLRWSILEFADDGSIIPGVWSDNITISVP